MRVGSLCSGIGGMDLGLERAGFDVVWQSEIDTYACKVLAKNFPGVRNLGDIRRIHEVPPAELICAGFPCQNISCAGRGEGLQGEQSSLWFDVLRVIRFARPRWALIENSPALRTRGMDTIYAGLEEAGYSCWPFVVGASDVGAPHRRKRAWIIAHAAGQQAGVAGQPREYGGLGEATTDPLLLQLGDQQGRRQRPGRTGETFIDDSEQEGDSPHPSVPGCENTGGQCQSSPSSGRGEPDADSQGESKRRLVRMVHEFPSGLERDRRPWGQLPDIPATIEKQRNRRARIRCLGNSVVPAIVEAIGRAILRVDRELRRG